MVISPSLSLCAAIIRSRDRYPCPLYSAGKRWMPNPPRRPVLEPLKGADCRQKRRFSVRILLSFILNYLTHQAIKSKVSLLAGKFQCSPTLSLFGHAFLSSVLFWILSLMFLKLVLLFLQLTTSYLLRKVSEIVSYVLYFRFCNVLRDHLFIMISLL